MAIVRPFKALRPRPDLVEKVASLPYDVMDRKEAKKMAKGNPYSFLHIVRSEIDYPSSTSRYDPKIYRKARKNLRIFEDDGILVQDDKAMVYIYRQIMDGREQTGFVAIASVDDYENNVIKKHELTLLRNEQDRVNHFDACDANTAPIFLTYKDEERLNEILRDWTEKTPTSDITTEDSVSHIVWTVDDPKLIKEITAKFADIESLYIADGHHRAASAMKVAQKRREEFPNYTGEEEFNYFMSVIFPESDLEIMSYNRVVHDLGGITLESFWNEMHKLFIIEELGAPYKPTIRKTWGMYVNKVWYKLTLKDGKCISDTIVDDTDAAVLERCVLDNILGIKNLRDSSRITFVGGIRGMRGLKEKTDELDGCGFAMFPVSMNEIMDVSDAGLIMPAKSTWFEPKLRSGLFVHKFDSHIAPEGDGNISKATHDYIEAVLQTVNRRDGHQHEFIQAVTEVFHSLGPVLEKNPEYIENNILERIVEPERAIQFNWTSNWWR